MPVLRGDSSCLVVDDHVKFEKGEPFTAPLSRSGPVAKLANAADLHSAAHLRASGFDPRLAHPRRALPVWCTGLASKAMETTGPVLGSIPRLSARDPIWVSYDEG